VLTLHCDFVAVRRLITIRGPREYDKGSAAVDDAVGLTIRCEPKGAVLVKVVS
jgi:hypothetical protein